MVGIFTGKLTQKRFHSQKHSLTALLVFTVGRKPQRDGCGFFVDGNLRPGMKHIVDGAFRKTHRRSDCGTDNVFPSLGIAAVPLTGKSQNPACSAIKPNSSH